jgi:hypothetical protein
MKIYISGPIAGHEDHRKAFDSAAIYLRTLSYEVVNPIDVSAYEHKGKCPKGYTTTNGHSSACYLRTDLQALLECDAIFMLPKWEGSVGARLEHSVAAHCGLLIYSIHTIHLLAREGRMMT